MIDPPRPVHVDPPVAWGIGIIRRDSMVTIPFLRRSHYNNIHDSHAYQIASEYWMNEYDVLEIRDMGLDDDHYVFVRGLRIKPTRMMYKRGLLIDGNEKSEDFALIDGKVVPITKTDIPEIDHIVDSYVPCARVFLWSDLKRVLGNDKMMDFMDFIARGATRTETILGNKMFNLGILVEDMQSLCYISEDIHYINITPVVQMATLYDDI
jgi:hypothetical protein